MMTAICLAVLLLAGAAGAQEDKLIAILRSDASTKQKADACQELARVGTRRAVPVLADFLADTNLSHLARYALEPIPDPSVDAALCRALGKVKGQVLVGLISSLGTRKDARAVKPLTGLLAASDPAVADAAARALGSVGGGPAATALEKALRTGGQASRPAVIEGLLRCAESLPAARAAVIYDRSGGPAEPAATGARRCFAGRDSEPRRRGWAGDDRGVSDGTGCDGWRRVAHFKRDAGRGGDAGAPGGTVAG